jgi:hypothetical protein
MTLWPCRHLGLVASRLSHTHTQPACEPEPDSSVPSHNLWEKQPLSLKEKHKLQRCNHCSTPINLSQHLRAKQLALFTLLARFSTRLSPLWMSRIKFSTHTSLWDSALSSLLLCTMRYLVFLSSIASSVLSCIRLMEDGLHIYHFRFPNNS